MNGSKLMRFSSPRPKPCPPPFILDLPIGRDGGRNVTVRVPDSRTISGLFTWTQDPLAVSVAVLGDQPSYYEHLRLSRMTAMDQSDDQRSSSSSSLDSDGFRAGRVISHVVAPV